MIVTSKQVTEQARSHKLCQHETMWVDRRKNFTSVKVLYQSPESQCDELIKFLKESFKEASNITIKKLKTKPTRPTRFELYSVRVEVR